MSDLNWTVLLAATEPNGGVLSMYEINVVAPSVEDAYEAALHAQDWSPENGGMLLSRLTAEGHEWGDGPDVDRLVIHDNNDPRKCWLSEVDQ
jgi:hypothetical protein